MVKRGFIAGIVVLAAALIAVQAAVVTPRGDSWYDDSNKDQRPIRWEGPIFEDGKFNEAYGYNMDDIWDKITRINAGRAWVTVLNPLDEPAGMLECGKKSTFAAGYRGQANELMIQLSGLGGRWTLDANRCYRLGCKGMTGLWWCNPHNRNIRALAKSLLKHADNIVKGCCPGNDKGTIMGRETYPNDHKEAAGSSVIFGYANCGAGHSNALPYYKSVKNNFKMIWPSCPRS
ncbi:hypothetical protein N0V88_002132 [Collariella sp. IMI 366227]|nr:hypothetical protein N0V88_002132 [Collariella sp. IMI 366227]